LKFFLTFKNLLPSSQLTPYLQYKEIQLIIFREIIYVYWKNDTKHVNVLYEQNSKLNHIKGSNYANTFFACCFCGDV